MAYGGSNDDASMTSRDLQYL